MATLKEMAHLSNGGLLDHLAPYLKQRDIALGVGAGVLLTVGLARRSVVALGLGGVAGALAVSGLMRRIASDGQDDLRQQVIHAPKHYDECCGQGDIREHEQMPRDQVDEASMESFPGSDPPAYTRAAI